MSISVGITSLGCAKNLVDSEVILGYLKSGGLVVCDDLADARVVIVNTCSFISEAEEEAAETIEHLLELKGKGDLDHLIVTGCMPARRGKNLVRRYPGIDYLLSPAEIPRVASIVKGLSSGNGRCAPGYSHMAERDGWYLYDHTDPRVRLSPPHYAYVKIGEGCGNRCSYCLIPLIKGPLRSRAMDSIIAEARGLASDGVREVNLISQDSTSYGLDLRGESGLVSLVRNLAEIEELRWIRILYGHPARFSDEILRCIAESPNVCRYIDFPLQHISDRILKRMNRRMTKTAALEKLEKIRDMMPGCAVRTTFIVGYPGETEKEFEELVDFVKEAGFEHMGAFIYSREKGTLAASAPGQIPHRVKRERFHRLMAAQQEIVRAANERLAGRVVEVIVDEELSEGSFRYRGRTQGDAPEVDGTVYVRGDGISPGDFVNVRITGAMDYDLAGELVNKLDLTPVP